MNFTFIAFPWFMVIPITKSEQTIPTIDAKTQQRLAYMFHEESLSLCDIIEDFPEIIE
jgi:hypothetical protein